MTSVSFKDQVKGESPEKVIGVQITQFWLNQEI
jgi:hypothetical protein